MPETASIHTVDDHLRRFVHRGVLIQQVSRHLIPYTAPRNLRLGSFGGRGKYWTH